MEDISKKKNDALTLITKDRKRTNILKKQEQNALAWLVQRVPEKVSSDALSFFGLFGNIMVGTSFVLGAQINRGFLLLSILGFIINWLGDSLDGRLAYYRNKPRKWYGFMLDVTIDWIGIIFIGIGFMIYVGAPYSFIGYLFIVFYGWEMITALLRYKIIDKYSIDSGIIGPTEVRIIIASIMIIETYIPFSIIYSSILIVFVLFISNLLETRKLIKQANFRDMDENVRKEILKIIEEYSTAQEKIN